MEIVLISKSNGALARLHVKWYAIAIAVGIIGLFGTGIFIAGHERGGDKMADRLLNDTTYASTFWQREISANRKFLGQLRTDFDADLTALSSKVGSLQAHIVRLDALAERVVNVAQLDSQEFALSESPAIGGPSDRATSTSWHRLSAPCPA